MSTTVPDHATDNPESSGKGAVDNGEGTGLLVALQDARESQNHPLRPALVQNAVSFLTNPQVQGSTDASKKAFLKSKGLTEDEIAEAERQVQNVSIQSAAPVTTRVVELPSTSTSAPPQLVVAQPQRTWLQTGFSTAVIVFAAYGIGTVSYPYVIRAWKWIKAMASPEEDQKENAQLLALLRQNIERQDETNRELKKAVSVLTSIREAQVAENSHGGIAKQMDSQFEELRKAVLKLNTAMMSSTTCFREISEIKSILQQQSEDSSQARGTGRDPAGVSDSADRALSARPLFASTAPASSAMFPGGTALSPDGLFGDPSFLGHGKSDGAQGNRPAMSDASNSELSEPPHPKSYTEVLELVKQGITPHGVKTDIVDQPIDPSRHPTPSAMLKKPKPWESDAVPQNGGLQGVLMSSSARMDPWSPPRIDQQSMTENESPPTVDDEGSTNEASPWVANRKKASHTAEAGKHDAQSDQEKSFFSVLTETQ